MLHGVYFDVGELDGCHCCVAARRSCVEMKWNCVEMLDTQICVVERMTLWEYKMQVFSPSLFAPHERMIVEESLAAMSFSPSSFA